VPVLIYNEAEAGGGGIRTGISTIFGQEDVNQMGSTTYSQFHHGGVDHISKQDIIGQIQTSDYGNQMYSTAPYNMNQVASGSQEKMTA
jgi:hypothetical protein